MTEIEVLDPATSRRITTIEEPDDKRGRVLALELVRAESDELVRLESQDVGWPTKVARESFPISADALSTDI